jgi:hypothetical protein
MSCCERCAGTHHRTYEVGGDGDGIEFLTEHDHLAGGEDITSTVVFCATGVGEAGGGGASSDRRRGGADPRTPPAIDG